MAGRGIRTRRAKIHLRKVFSVWNSHCGRECSEEGRCFRGSNQALKMSKGRKDRGVK